MVPEKEVQTDHLSLHNSEHSDKRKKEKMSKKHTASPKSVPLLPKSNYHGHQREINTVVVNRKGSLAVSGSLDRKLVLWNIHAAKYIDAVELPGIVYSVAMNEAGTIAIAVTEDNKLYIWNLKEGGLGFSLIGHMGNIICTDMSKENDSNMIVTGGIDGTVRLCHLSPKKEHSYKAILIETFKGHVGWVMCVAICDNRNIVISGGIDKTVRIWNVDKGKCLAILTGHPITVCKVAINSEATMAVSGDLSGNIYIWNLKTLVLMQELKCHTSKINFLLLNSVSNLLVSGSDDKTISTWRLNSSNNLFISEEVLDYNQRITAASLIYYSEQYYIMIGRQDGEIFFHHLCSYFPKKTIALERESNTKQESIDNSTIVEPYSPQYHCAKDKKIIFSIEKTNASPPNKPAENKHKC